MSIAPLRSNTVRLPPQGADPGPVENGAPQRAQRIGARAEFRQGLPPARQDAHLVVDPGQQKHHGLKNVRGLGPLFSMPSTVLSFFRDPWYEYSA